MSSMEPETLATRLPSMGGREIGPFLRSLARRVQRDSHIVELGSWLGAGSAQLALGLRERRVSDKVTLNCYDRWLPPTAEERRIASAQGAELIDGMNTFPLIEETLSALKAKVRYHRGEIGRAAWNDKRISLFVDHLDDDGATVRHALKTFGPSWMAGGCVVVFMTMQDTPRAAAARGCPRARLMLDHPENFLEVHADLGTCGRAWFYARALHTEIWAKAA